MDTQAFIAKLRNRRHKPENVSLRQALCYYLAYKNKIPYSVVAPILGITNRYVYDVVFNVHERVSAMDKYTLDAIEELSNHSIVMKPKFTMEGMSIKFIGYELIIDNVNF